MECCINTDKELWREKPGDFYSNSVHVTECGGLGINCGGHVIVAPLKAWHNAGELILCVNPNINSWRYKLAMWLLSAQSVRNNRTKSLKE